MTPRGSRPSWPPAFGTERVVGLGVRARALGGRSEILHPFEIVRLDRTTAGYVDGERYKAAGFGSGVTLESAECLMRFPPETVGDRIAPRPLPLVHGDSNDRHSPDESRSLHERAGDNSELMLLEGSGHTGWMYDDHPTFTRVVDCLLAFYGDALSERSTVGASAE